MISTVDPDLEAVLGVPLRAAGAEVRWCCPFCPKVMGREDTKYHLYYNTVSGKWHCHRCERGGKSLHKTLKLDQKIEQPLTEWDDIVARFTHPELAAQADAQRLEVELDDYVPIFQGSDAHTYCLARGITEETIREAWLGLGTRRPTRKDPSGLAGRIILPDWWQGKLVYWTARLYQPAPDYVPRYKNPKVPKGGSVFNLERAWSYDEVDICEGPISALVAGPQAVCTYSKAYTAAQALRIAQGPWKRFYVAYDGDATNKTIELAHYLWGEGKDVRMVLFEDHPKRKDAADVGLERYQVLKAEAVPYDPIEVLRVLVDRGVLRAW